MDTMTWIELLLDCLDFQHMTDEQAAEIAQAIAEAQDWMRLELALRG